MLFSDLAHRLFNLSRLTLPQCVIVCCLSKLCGKGYMDMQVVLVHSLQVVDNPLPLGVMLKVILPQRLSQQDAWGLPASPCQNLQRPCRVCYVRKAFHHAQGLLHHCQHLHQGLCAVTSAFCKHCRCSLYTTAHVCHCTSGIWDMMTSISDGCIDIQARQLRALHADAKHSCLADYSAGFNITCRWHEHMRTYRVTAVPLGDMQR